MKDLRYSPPSATTEDHSPESKVNTSSNQNVDAATIENNPKVDTQLVSDFYRLVEALQGVIRSGQGANYGLAHPLDSKVVPTDPSQIENSPSENSPSKVKET